MTELKTKEINANVDVFVKKIENEVRRNDCLHMLSLMRRITKKEPKMWGTSPVGFGNYHYEYASGREGDWFVTGFSPRKKELTIYIMPGFSGYSELMEKLGRYRTGKSCLYLKQLADIDLEVLEKIISQSVRDMKKLYKCM